MKTLQDIQNMIKNNVEEYRAEYRRISDEIKTLEKIYDETRFDATPADTIQKVVDAIGYDRLSVVLASLINASAWDGRISEYNKEAAAAIEDAYNEEACIKMSIYTKIHMSHLDQLFDAFRRFEKPANPAPSPVHEIKKETKTFYVTFTFGSAAYISVDIYEGLTMAECMKIRSDDIEAYFDTESKSWITVTGDGIDARRHLKQLREGAPAVEVAEMHETVITLGLLDKDTCRQEISDDDAQNMIDAILLEKYNIFAYTLQECRGCYKMQSTGAVIHEKSIRLEIVTEGPLECLPALIRDLKKEFNQESVMIAKSIKNIAFC